MGMEASGVTASQFQSAGVDVSSEAGGSLQQQASVEVASVGQDQQEQQGQNAVALIKSSGIGQNVNVQA
jgi:hypothetical protein